MPLPPARRVRGRPSALSNTVALLLVIALAVYAYERYSHEAARGDARQERRAPGTTPLAEPFERPIELERACDGRTQCSQMTSCTESKYFLQNCPAAQLDGNRNGIPCEKSWCSSPLAI